MMDYWFEEIFLPRVSIHSYETTYISFAKAKEALDNCLDLSEGLESEREPDFIIRYQ